MSFPGDIFNGISRFFNGNADEVLLYIIVFIFFFLTGNRDENKSDEISLSGILPIVLIVIFLFFSLSGNDKANIEN